MYALGWIAFILGIVFVVVSAFVLVAGLAESDGLIAVGGLVGVVVTAAMIWWGMSTVLSIEREQCEAAGFEWITGTCYGSNVNVNK